MNVLDLFDILYPIRVIEIINYKLCECRYICVRVGGIICFNI